MNDINDVCDYIIIRMSEAGEDLNHLKLQKLLYYTQAWSLALDDIPLFEGEFQAWIHGPVNRQIYDRFKDTKGLLAPITEEDVRSLNSGTSIDEDDQWHINRVLEVYGSFTGSELEEISHKEKPWIEARKGYAPNQRCEVVINQDTMRAFYKARSK